MIEPQMFVQRFPTCVIAICLAFGAATSPADELTPEQTKFFETKIRPVLIKECYGCHSSESGNAKGGLRLDTRQLTFIGGSSGPAIVPGDLAESLLFNAITHEDFVMPPKRKLPPSVIEDFRQWIEMGAPDPRQTKMAEIRSTISDEDIRKARQSFWAYQCPVEQSPPAVEDSDWVRTDIDRFILAKLELSGLSPAADAQPHKILRRLCLDLIGLPPTPEQIEQFSKRWAQSPDQAVASIVDQLLGKEQFGERWGRHWLDVARYAESTGREVNMTFPHAWRYRDYVIDSFNDDKPFDRFVQEQIAGDLLPVETDQQWTENLIATTFLAMGPKNVNEQNGVQFAADLADEQIDTTTRVFLGTSVACARCHDHKFDAIPQSDYYAMAGIFASTATFFGNPPSQYGSFSGVQARRSSSLLRLPVEDPSSFDKRYSQQELAALRQELTDKLAELADLRRQQVRGQGDAANAGNAVRNRLRLNNQLATLSAKLAVVDSDGRPLSYCMGVQDLDSPRDVRVLVRGEIDQPGPIVSRGVPQVLSEDPVTVDSDSSGRLELARWIGSDQSPLTARVMVNRIWQHLIGQGIVTSTENFGVTGQSPSHPELLDHLAVRFAESGWSVKTIIREIATSRVYRLSSAYDEESFQYDPDNALVWRANARRLDAEAIRDAMLSISGAIDLQRPRGSEVAKAGYVRVRDGVLGDPREMARRMVGQMARPSAEAMRQRFQRGRGSQPSGGGVSDRGRYLGPQAGGRIGFRGRMQRGGLPSMQDFASRIQDRLDMNEATFRSVYLPIVRDEEPRSLEVFDLAESSMVVGTRESSNTANQALYMMNNPLVIEQSEAFAERVAEGNPKIAEQMESAFMLAYGRPPTAGERTAASSFFKSFSPANQYRAGQYRAGQYRSGQDRARQYLAGRGETMTAFCQSLFASAEFRYID
jgi:hypothetical protein